MMSVPAGAAVVGVVEEEPVSGLVEAEAEPCAPRLTDSLAPRPGVTEKRGQAPRSTCGVRASG
jgi:hypothetical protein